MNRTRYLFNLGSLDPGEADLQRADMAIRKRNLLCSMHTDLFLASPDVKKRDDFGHYDKKRKTTATRRVRFTTTEDSVQLLDTIDSSELDQTWYNDADYARFKMEGRDTIIALSEAMGNHELLDHNQHCLRGFEDYTSTNRLELKRQRQRACEQSVLNNYRLQRQLGVKNLDSLRMISLIYSKSSKYLALKRGNLHAAIIDDNNVL